MTKYRIIYTYGPGSGRFAWQELLVQLRMQRMWGDFAHIVRVERAA